MCAEKENNEDFSQGFFLQCPQKTWSPNDIILKSKKFFTGQKKIDLNDFKQNPDITYFTYFKKSADLAT